VSDGSPKTTPRTFGPEPGPRLARVGLLGKFAILSLIPMVLLGVVLADTFSERIRRRALENATGAATLVAQLGIQPLVSPDSLREGLTPAQLEALDDAVRTGLLGKEVVRVKIWSRDHRILYSDQHDLIGRRFPPGDELLEALEGEVASEVSSLEGEEEQTERRYGRLLEVYVPLRFEPAGSPAGAFEVYLPYLPIEAAIGGDTRRLHLLLGLGLLLLWAMLLPIAYRAGRVLRDQADRLRAHLSREKETVRRLEELNRMKSEFISTASHEMRTPLTSIIGFAKSLQQSVFAENKEMREEFLERMERQGDRLLQLVDQLLHTSRLEGARVEPRLEPFDFGLLANEITDAIDHEQVSMRLHLPQSLPPLVSDRGMVSHILTNLLTNAVKYSPADTVVTVGARAGLDGFHFWVADQGVGMTPEQVQHAFEPFWRADSSLTRETGGVGLGLYLVKLLASGLGGEVRVESQIHRGTRFTVSLPSGPLPSAAQDPGAEKEALVEAGR
jgi:signal transduction histidine kinase